MLGIVLGLMLGLGIVLGVMLGLGFRVRVGVRTPLMSSSDVSAWTHPSKWAISVPEWPH